MTGISKDIDFKACKHFDEEAEQIPISDQYARETASKEVVHRLASAGHWGWKKNFFIGMS